MNILTVENNLTVPVRTLKQAKEIVGGWTVTKKMETISWSTSAKDCNTGSKLRKIKNSVCSKCYALKGNYARYAKNIEPAMRRRLESINNASWVDAMIYIMNNQKQVVNSGLFRWHDSGDIQNLDHFKKIIKVAEKTPQVKHWLPTKESNLIQNYKGAIPKNLIIRLSGSFIDGKQPKYSHTSTVTTDREKATCRSFENGGACGPCVKCWDSSVKNVSYLSH